MLASRLMVSASGCYLLVCQHKQQGMTRDQVPVPPVPLRLLDTWSTMGTHTGHHGPPGLGQYFLFAMALWTVLAGSNMAWTKNKWDNDDYILFFVFFHINVSMKKKGKPCQFLVP